MHAGARPLRVLDKTNLTGVVANQQSVAISNANDVETATIEFTGKDQYGQDKAIENLQVERLTSPNNVDAAHWTIDGNKLTFKGCDQTPGTYTYRVFADNAKKVSTVVSVIVKKPTVPMTDGAPDISKAASYRIVPMSGNVELDPSKADSNAEYKFRIVAQDGAGVAFAVVKDNGVINELAVKFGNDTFKAFDDTDRDADGIYTVNFAVTGSGEDRVLSIVINLEFRKNCYFYIRRSTACSLYHCALYGYGRSCLLNGGLSGKRDEYTAAVLTSDYEVAFLHCVGGAIHKYIVAGTFCQGDRTAAYSDAGTCHSKVYGVDTICVAVGIIKCLEVPMY